LKLLIEGIGRVEGAIDQIAERLRAQQFVIHEFQQLAPYAPRGIAQLALQLPQE